MHGGLKFNEVDLPPPGQLAPHVKLMLCCTSMDTWKNMSVDLKLKCTDEILCHYSTLWLVFCVFCLFVITLSLYYSEQVFVYE